MKLKATLVAAMLSVAPSLFAFSLDFAAYSGQTIPATLIINVAGYGDVKVEAPAGSPVTVGTIYGSPAVQFNPGQQIVVTFLGAAVTDFDSIDLGLDGGENFITTFNAAGNRGSFTLNGAGVVPGAGISGITFNSTTAVPEPSASLLGLLGATGLIIRRRR